MKFIIILLIIVLIISTLAKFKFAKQFGIIDTKSFIKMFVLPIVFALIAIGVIFYVA